MIEYVRFGLALIVAQTHIWVPFNDAHLGQQSVFAFYTLSGYLMTRVLNERYGFSTRGTMAFAANRILRLWPAYLIVSAISLAALQFLPLSNINQALRIPQTPFEILINLTILGEVWFDNRWMQGLPFLAVTSWSLSIELASYFLLAVYFARSEARLAAFGALGLVFILASFSCDGSTFYGPYCYQNRYGVLQAGFLPFAVGGLLHFRGKKIRLSWSRLGLLAAGLFLAEVLCWRMPGLKYTVSPYLGCVMMALLILVAPQRPSTPTRDFFGRASYHLFIAHLTIAAILMAVGITAADQFSTFAATVAASLTLSAALVPLEHRVNRLRAVIARRGDVAGQTPNEFVAL